MGKDQEPTTKGQGPRRSNHGQFQRSASQFPGEQGRNKHHPLR